MKLDQRRQVTDKSSKAHHTKIKINQTETWGKEFPLPPLKTLNFNISTEVLLVVFLSTFPLLSICKDI